MRFTISTLGETTRPASGWRWIGVSLLLVLGVSGVAALSIRPFLVEALADSPLRTVAEVSLLAAAVLAPVIAVVRAALLAAVTMATSILIEETVRFLALLRVYVVAEVALASAGLAAAAVIAARGRTAAVSAEDLQVPLGLDLVWTPSSPLLASLLRDVTVFHAAWIVIVAIGLHRVVGLSREGALVGTVAGYAGLVGASAVRAAVMT